MRDSSPSYSTSINSAASSATYLSSATTAATFLVRIVDLVESQDRLPIVHERGHPC
jgi:hypothetical protein